MSELLLGNTLLAYMFWGVFGYVFSTLVLRPLFEGRKKGEEED
jgi:hypothetical protein